MGGGRRDVHEPLVVRTIASVDATGQQQKETGRVEAFSDGVFAIAITLLILDLHVPLPPASGGPFNLAAELGRLWTSLLAYFMSFAIILVMWVNHHRIFALVRRVDQAFLFWNGLLLMFVTFVPFPTSLLAAYMGRSDRESFRTAAIVYSGHGCLIAVAFIGLWRYAIKGGRLLAPGPRVAREVAEMSAQYRWGPLAYLTAFVTAFVSPWTSVCMCLALAVSYAVRGFATRVK